ncbi:MAG: hypothetical protein EHM21_02975 [Chloroflexi bacterium]|nr:MAG: hypothetical protein EHM21_02975 [Chloroflexota bacterium]
MYMILCVIDQPDHVNAVLNEWQRNGITGVTIVESTGLHRLGVQPHIPMRYVFGSTSTERGNMTLFTVVEKEETIQRCLEITEGITGDFSLPNTGIFIAWPLGFAKGVTGKQPRSSG